MFDRNVLEDENAHNKIPAFSDRYDVFPTSAKDGQRIVKTLSATRMPTVVEAPEFTGDNKICKRLDCFLLKTGSFPERSRGMTRKRHKGMMAEPAETLLK